MDHIWVYVSGHFQPNIWIPDIIYLLEALSSGTAHASRSDQLQQQNQHNISTQDTTL